MATKVITKEDLLKDLDKHAELLIKCENGKKYGGQFSSSENQIAGVIHYLSDTLVNEFGMDRTTLSDEHGFGRIVRETER